MKRGLINPKQWLVYIEQQIGFILPSSQQLWLTNAIEQFAKQSAMSTEALWWSLPNDRNLQQRFIDHVVIAQTHFFRHKPSIEFVTQVVGGRLSYILTRSELSDLRPSPSTMPTITTPTITPTSSTRIFSNTSNATTDAVKVWCAGCSTGQEVWSLAMAIHNQVSKLTDNTKNWLANLSILGTDVSLSAIEQARQAQYPMRQLIEIPKQYHCHVHHNDANQGKDGQDKDNGKSSHKVNKADTEQFWQVSSHLFEMVDFAQSNLFLPAKTAQADMYDVIFCQNLLIYFREFDQRDLLAQFVKQCRVGGYLLLAPGEAMSWQHPLMKRVKRTDINAWQKMANTNTS